LGLLSVEVVAGISEDDRDETAVKGIPTIVGFNSVVCEVERFSDIIKLDRFLGGWSFRKVETPESSDELNYSYESPYEELLDTSMGSDMGTIVRGRATVEGMREGVSSFYGSKGREEGWWKEITKFLTES